MTSALYSAKCYVCGEEYGNGDGNLVSVWYEAHMARLHSVRSSPVPDTTLTDILAELKKANQSSPHAPTSEDVALIGKALEKVTELLERIANS